MFHKSLFALFVFLALGRLCPAQEWANKMFAETSHDFGTVARGALVEYTFTLQNIYEEDVHIASVTSSCGCTTPSVDKPELKTWDEAKIKAVVDTRGYTGRKDATLTVVFDLPFPAEVQLHIHAFIRSDVVVQPGAVEFGTIDQGAAERQTLKVDYAGRGDWRIDHVESPVAYLDAAVLQTARAADRVAYDLVVTLKPNAPAGAVHEHLVLVTNDVSNDAARVPVRVDAVVSPGITAQPSTLNFGAVALGGTQTRRVVVQGKKAFRILAVKSADPRFSAAAGSDARNVQIVPVTFRSAGEPGAVEVSLVIETDQSACPRIVVPAFARVAQATTANTSPASPKTPLPASAPAAAVHAAPSSAVGQ